MVEENNNKKKRKSSLSVKVIVATVILTVISIASIVWNEVSISDVGKNTDRYNSYIGLLKDGESIEVAFLEVQMYANFAYYKQDEEDVDSILDKLGTAAESLSGYCDELDNQAEDLLDIVDSNHDDELAAAINDWTASLREFADVADTAYSAGKKGDFDSVAAFAGQVYSYKQQISEAENVYLELLDSRVTLLEERTDNQITSAYIFDNIIIALNLIVEIVVVLILYNQLVKPARSSQNKAREIVEKIQAGNGDLTERVPVKANDEVGALSTGINEMIGQLHSIMSKLEGHAETLHDVSESLADNIKKSQDEISNVSSTMEEMSASSQETSASLSQVTEQVNGIAGLVNGVYNQALTQAETAEKILRNVNNMREAAIEERNKSDEHANSIVDALQVSIESARKVEKIYELVNDILSISEQTNLLSLNASIEAARAGEAGKGFAVVADEISKLAKDSADAASHIQEVSTEVISAVNELTEKAKDISDTLIESNASGREGVARMTDSYHADIDDMAKAMDEFANSSQKVQESMEIIKDAISAINIAVEENVDGITNVTNSTVDITTTIIDIQEKSRINLDISNELYEEVNKFKL